MKSLDLFQLRNDFAEVNVLTCFSGPFSHTIIQEVGAAVRRYLESEEVAREAVLDVFAVYVELAQNVKNYQARTRLPADLSCRPQNAIVAILAVDQGYVVTAGNVALSDDARVLEETIRHLSGLDDTQLRKMRRERLRQERDPSSECAGLGLIDIARRAKSITCSRTPVEHGLEFLSLYVQL